MALCDPSSSLEIIKAYLVNNVQGDLSVTVQHSNMSSGGARRRMRGGADTITTTETTCEQETLSHELIMSLYTWFMQQKLDQSGDTDDFARLLLTIAQAKHDYKFLKLDPHVNAINTANRLLTAIQNHNGRIMFYQIDWSKLSQHIANDPESGEPLINEESNQAYPIILGFQMTEAHQALLQPITGTMTSYALSIGMNAYGDTYVLIRDEHGLHTLPLQKSADGAWVPIGNYPDSQGLFSILRAHASYLNQINNVLKGFRYIFPQDLYRLLEIF